MAENWRYRRIRGRTWRPEGSYHVYLADDHFLELCNSTFFESYRRFFFRELRSFAIEKTATYNWFNGILVAWALIFFLILLVSGVSPGWAIVVSWPLPGVLLAVNLARGPTCRCRVATGVQTTVLGAFRRERTARRARDAIAEYLVAHQGERLAPGDIRKRADKPAGATEIPEGTVPSAEEGTI